MVKRGVAVQTYEGHVNSHTRIEFGIDPSERFLMSGYKKEHFVPNAMT